MLYREIIAICSEVHTKHINTLCGAERRILEVKALGSLSKYRDLEKLAWKI